MSTTPKRSLETDGTKEEEWEVVSGAKSLSSEPKVPPENKENEEKRDSSQTNENQITETDKEESIIQQKDTKNEVVEKEPEDWYQTIPSTPMNTPEYTAGPPTYPSTNRMAEIQQGPDVIELTPITEETAEDQNPNPSASEERTPAEETQEEPQSTDSNILKKSLAVICYTLTRLTLVIIIFGILKWSVTKLCEKIKKIKESRPQTRQTVE